MLRAMVFFLFKETHFYADLLLATSRCATRGFSLSLNPRTFFGSLVGV
jgi:hypothetical protein